MLFRKVLPQILAIGLLDSTAFAETVNNCEPRYHKVQKDTSLGSIARFYGFTPIWGRGNYVEKISKLNKLRDSDKILPGQLIQLPYECQAVAEIASPPEPLNSPAKNAEETMEIPKQNGFSEFSAGVNTGFMVINSKDNLTGDKANLVSSPIMGLDLGYQTNWTKKFATSLHYSFQRISMRSSSEGEINNPVNSLSEFGLNFKYQTSTLGHVSFLTQYGERLYVRGTDVGVATLDKVLVPGFGLEYRHTVFSNPKTKLDLFGGYRILLGLTNKNNTIENGSEYYFGPAVLQKFQHHVLELKLNYLQNEQNSELFDQTTSRLGLGARMIWEMN